MGPKASQNIFRKILPVPGGNWTMIPKSSRLLPSHCSSYIRTPFKLIEHHFMAQ